MTWAFSPSDTLILAWRWPSLSRIWARLRRSASACSSMAARTPAGAVMSRISYRMHCRPQALAASLSRHTPVLDGVVYGV